LVVHYQIPDCLEAYYQEAGRAGRNGNAAFCLLLYHASDAHILRAKLAKQFPEPEVLSAVYNHLGSYFQVASYANISTEPDTDFCIRLAKEFGVAAIPLSVFNANGEDRHLIRFCYAKTDATLQAAIKVLCKI